ncbi:GH1 family beta-glucosidase [Maribacter sp. SA7]|uniref:GH1 family beta-glucosidase n=1 Tax=Maribacter zhoushanensis TaxID=3030012 RepID=UPI0023ECE516|nr:GH1 family beta-glucosidase [Maribacter zhoushanensis]MDF4201893.1 GH1 family beta-glucosidase [Maribacter zhoushanensis]
MKKQKELLFNASEFGENFAWGVSTAAYQIEGAFDSHGKGPSIWDTFTALPKAIRKRENAKVSCDFYHKYKEDILLMKSMNIDNYRFSISWARVLPNGTGTINEIGLQFYNDVINFCLAQEITPWVTLYHWDLPQSLEEKGGWTNRAIIQWFSEFTKVCANAFGDRVKNWMVLNEPMVFIGAGYFLGVHAPGKKRLKNFMPAAHHAVLCQAEGGRILRKLVPNANIGTTFSCSQITPYRENNRDKKTAVKVDALLNRMFIEPALGLGYPVKEAPVLKKLQPYIKPNDMINCKFDFDFIGIQNYTREKVKYSLLVPYIRAKIVKASKRNVKTTLMDWEVYPPSIYNMIEKFSNYPQIKKLIITENGAAFKDKLEGENITDDERVRFLQRYLRQVLKAKQDGLNIHGYFVWTFTDNFEWAEGYYPRFGLVHIDFKTLKRTIKKSGKWFSEFLAN